MKLGLIFHHHSACHREGQRCFILHCGWNAQAVQRPGFGLQYLPILHRIGKGVFICKMAVDPLAQVPVFRHRVLVRPGIELGPLLA